MTKTIEVKIKTAKSIKNFPLPKYETAGSAGMDLSANIDSSVIIAKGQRKLIPTGLFIGLPNGYEAQIRPRSGLAIKHGITVLNTPGTIDSDYRGEIMVILINLSDTDFVIENGMRIAQIVISPIVQANLIKVDSLDDTHRGDKGFGSTGI